MNLMGWIAAMLLLWNAMLAAGWRYDPYTNAWTPPAQAERAGAPVAERAPARLRAGRTE